MYSHSHTAHTLKSACVEVNRVSDDLCFSLDSLDLKVVAR